ncbi:MAG: ThuA domain-containing protein, partial [Pedobacter sp.]|nr:ThuA domain-containing protein [Pedobacter sp.]
NLWYKDADANTLENEGHATVRYTDNTDSIAFYLEQTDVLYLSNNQPIKNVAVRKAIFDFVNAGKGLILGHAALWYNWEDWPDYNLQLVSGGTKSHDSYGNFEVTVVNKNHPILKGVESKITLKDERYHYEPDAAGPGIEVLATSNNIAGSAAVYPSIFVVKNPKARIVGIALGHDAASHNTAFYKTILVNAMNWVAHK